MSTFFIWFVVSAIIMIVESVGNTEHRPTVASAIVIGLWTVVYLTLHYADTVVWLPKIW